MQTQKNGRVLDEFDGKKERFEQLWDYVLTANFGNQAFDHALLQLADFVRKRGFRLVDGAAAFR
jgi:hypothetical protein